MFGIQKFYLGLLGLFMALAFAGILYENGKATPLTYACVAPAAIYILLLVVAAFANTGKKL